MLIARVLSLHTGRDVGREADPSDLFLTNNYKHSYMGIPFYKIAAMITVKGAACEILTTCQDRLWAACQQKVWYVHTPPIF